MKIFKVLATAAIIAAVSTNAAFAISQSTVGSNSTTIEKKVSPGNKYIERNFDRHGDRKLDPVKMLERKKERIQQLLKEGTITQEQANRITAKIDERIKEVKEFDKLSLKDKKEKLTANFKEFIGRKLKDGRLTQEKADELTKEFNKRLNQWDGKSYPFFVFRGICRQHGDRQDK